MEKSKPKSAQLSWLQSYKEWRWLDEHARVLTLLVSIIGVILIVSEIRTDINVRKIDRTLNYASRYQSESLQTARMHLVQVSQSYQMQLLDQKGKVRVLSEAQLRRIISSEFLDDTANARRLKHYVYQLSEFFDELWICVDMEACDLKTACRYFHTPAKNMASTYEDVLDLKNRLFSTDRVGRGIKRLGSERECSL